MDTTNRKARAEALESLRARHLEDLEAIYQSQYVIATSEDSQDRDKINAGKNLLTILGVSRPGPEKPPETPKEKVHADAPAPLRQELLDAIDKKLGVK